MTHKTMVGLVLGGGAVMMGLVIAVLASGVGKEVMSAMPFASANAVLDRPWTNDTLLGMDVMMPTELLPPARVDRGEDGTLESIETIQTLVAMTQIYLTRISYTPAAEIDLQAGVDGAIGAIRDVQGVSNVDGTQEQLIVSGCPAVRSRTNFMNTAQSWRSEMLMFTKGQQLWQINLVYPVSEERDQIAGRLLGSVSLIEPCEN